MQLDFAGAPTILAPLAEVWGRLLDPHAVAAAAPSVESVELVDATHFRIVSGFGVGAIRMNFKLDVKFSDIVEHTSASMSARGKAPGSEVHVHTAIELDEKGPRETQLRWRATATIDGVIVRIGARLLEGAVSKLTVEFWETFARQASEASAEHA